MAKEQAEERDYLADERPRIVGFVTGICFVIIVPFVLNNLLQGRYLVSLGALGLMVVLASNFLAFWRKKKPPIDIIYAFPAVAIFLLVCFKKQGLIGVFWCFPSIVSMHFMLSPRRVRLAEWIVLAIATVGGYFTLPPTICVRFLATLVMTTLFCRLFLRIISEQQARLFRVSEDLASKLQQLEESNRKLAKAENHRREFLATVSHEFRTPMNAIVGFTDLALRRDPGDKKVLRDLVRVSNASKNLLSLLNDILDFSRIEAGKLRLQQEQISIPALLRDIRELFTASATAKGLEFQCKASHDMPQTMVGDPLRIQQILTNLIGNALKFTSKGEIAVSVAESVHRERIIFSVSDTGSGIPQEKLGELFQPFHQVGSDLSHDQSTGTGLGLSISKRLAELMGGDLTVESKAGQGSTFHFSLPIGGLQHLPTQELGGNGRSRVLVLGKDTPESYWLEETLLGFRYEVTKIYQPHEAFAVLQTQMAHYKLLVLDTQSLSDKDWERLSGLLAECEDKPKLILISDGGANDPGWPASEAVLRRPLSASSLLDAIVDLTEHSVLPPALQRNNDGLDQQLPFSGYSVLVVDDVAPNRELAEELLQQMGLEVVCAGNGRTALHLGKEHKFDLVLMDVNMPGLDGYETTRRWRESGDSSTPIVAVTAHASEIFRDASLDAGMDDHLAKPISLDTLYKLVAKWLTPRESGAPMQSSDTTTQAVFSGIDVAEALERLDGNQPLLRTLIRSFLNNYQHIGEQLHALHAEGDLQALKDKGHEVKGAAANISAKELARVAESLENCRDLDEAVSYIEGITGLMALVGQDEPSGTLPGSQPDGDLLESLVRLLADQDLEALSYLEASRSQLKEHLGVEVFQNLERCCQELDFEQALAILKTR